MRFDDGLLERAKREAKRRHVTLTALLEEGLHLVLAKGQRFPPRARVLLPVSSAAGGTLPGVDLNDGAVLLEIMETRQ